MKISSVLSVGDVVYSARDGKPMKVTAICQFGFRTEKDYFPFDEHRKKFFYTRVVSTD